MQNLPLLLALAGSPDAEAQVLPPAPSATEYVQPLPTQPIDFRVRVCAATGDLLSHNGANKCVTKMVRVVPEGVAQPYSPTYSSVVPTSQEGFISLDAQAIAAYQESLEGGDSWHLPRDYADMQAIRAVCKNEEAKGSPLAACAPGENLWSGLVTAQRYIMDGVEPFNGFLPNVGSSLFGDGSYPIQTMAQAQWCDPSEAWNDSNWCTSLAVQNNYGEAVRYDGYKVDSVPFAITLDGSEPPRAHVILVADVEEEEKPASAVAPVPGGKTR